MLGEGPPRCQEDKATPRAHSKGQSRPGSVEMDGAAVVPPHLRDEAQTPVPCASQEDDEACAEEEDGLAGGFAGSTGSVCAKVVGRRIHLLGVMQVTTSSLPPLPQLLHSCTNCRGICQLMQANLRKEILRNVC